MATGTVTPLTGALGFSRRDRMVQDVLILSLPMKPISSLVFLLAAAVAAVSLVLARGRCR